MASLSQNPATLVGLGIDRVRRVWLPLCLVCAAGGCFSDEGGSALTTAGSTGETAATTNVTTSETTGITTTTTAATTAADSGGSGGATGPSDTTGSVDCGNGMIDDGELCDDGNAFDDDACDNACQLGTITVGGTNHAAIDQALVSLGEDFDTVDDRTWPAQDTAGVFIVHWDGWANFQGALPDYETKLEDGGHVLVVGGDTSTADFANWLSTFLAVDTGSWHTSETCVDDWQTVGADPIVAMLPPTYEFPDQPQGTLHHVHPLGGADNVLLARTCHGGAQDNVAVVRRFAGGGSVTYVAFRLGRIADASVAELTLPLLQGYLAAVRAPPP